MSSKVDQKEVRRGLEIAQPVNTGFVKSVCQCEYGSVALLDVPSVRLVRSLQMS